MNLDEKREALKSIMETIEPIVEREFNAQRITPEKYAEAYLGTIQTAMQIAYGSDAENKEAELKEYQLKHIMPMQLEILKAEHALKLAQIEQIKRSVQDNRLIKSIDSLGNTAGMAMSGKVTIPKELWIVLFGLINKLNDSTYTHP